MMKIARAGALLLALSASAVAIVGIFMVRTEIFQQDMLYQCIVWGSVLTVIFAVHAWRRRPWAFVGSFVLSLAMLVTQWINYRRLWEKQDYMGAPAEILFLFVNGLIVIGCASGIYAGRVGSHRR